MADLSISLKTDYPPSQINNVDILIAEHEDLGKTQFRIMNSFPDHLNLLDGVVLTKFRNLDRGKHYYYVLRIFLNQAPFVVNKSVITVVNNEENEDLVVISA